MKRKQKKYEFKLSRRSHSKKTKNMIRKQKGIKSSSLTGNEAINSEKRGLFLRGMPIKTPLPLAGDFLFIFLLLFINNIFLTNTYCHTHTERPPIHTHTH